MSLAGLCSWWLPIAPVAADAPAGAASIQFVDREGSSSSVKWKPASGEPASQFTPRSSRRVEATQAHYRAGMGEAYSPDNSPAPDHSPEMDSVRPVSGERALSGGKRHHVPRWAARGPSDTVRPASNSPASVHTADPFEDPFGDRLNESRASTRPSANSGYAVQLQPPQDLPQDLKPPQDEELRSVPDASPEAPPRRQPAEQDREPNRDREPDQERGEFLLPPGEEREPADRIYNRRNCDDELEKCKLARARLFRNPIQDISLDITPSFHPKADSPQEAQDYKRTTLARAPSRTWRSRDGQVLAKGQFRDYRNTRVIVLTEEGEQVPIAFQELSTEDACFVAAWWGMPHECRLEGEEPVQRNWMPSTFTWKASALCHKPLYFEEVQLERYGHTAGPLIQPALSGAHFFLNIAALPYKAGIHPPTECQYPLGYYRPGSCAPWLLPPVPLSLRGALLEAGVWTGGVFLLP